MNALLPPIAALVAVIHGAACVAEEAGDAARGETLFNVCAGCHQIGPGAANRVGPHLNGLIGRVAGSVEGFAYSEAFGAARERGLVWREDVLRAYIARPENVVPGTRMIYPGMKRPRDRTDLVAYLGSVGGGPETVIPAAEDDPAVAIARIEGDVEYGAYLASECTTCHAPDGGDGDIPRIVGWQVEDFARALAEYRSGVRAHPVMNAIAGRLGDEEIAALAAYFATLEN